MLQMESPALECSPLFDSCNGKERIFVFCDEYLLFNDDTRQFIALGNNAETVKNKLEVLGKIDNFPGI